MDLDLYDEFGNYIGSEQDDDVSDDENESIGHDRLVNSDNVHKDISSDDESDGAMDVEQNAIILHEDKQYYPDAEDIYQGAEVRVEDEDAQGIDEPILKPAVVKYFQSEDHLKVNFSMDFLSACMNNSKNIRNIAIVGHLHHGKTSFCDMLIESTLADEKSVDLYCDARHDEQARKISIKCTPMTLPLQDSRGKTYVINFVDCPGHVNFSDETVASLPLCEGAILVVDAVEGVMINTERMIANILKYGMQFCVCISKVDRLIHELRLPPTDAYFKLAHIVDQINSIVSKHSKGTHPEINPLRGNVCFASGLNRWCFTLESFAQAYANRQPKINALKFAKKLWGDSYYNKDSRKFEAAPPNGKVQRSFVAFVLEPIYKLHAQILGESANTIQSVAKSVGIRVTKSESLSDSKILVRMIMSRFFSDAVGAFTDMVCKHVRCPQAISGDTVASEKIGHMYNGNLNSSCANAILNGDSDGPLISLATKHFSSRDGKTFSTWVRVFSGSLKAGQQVKILGEGYSPINTEDVTSGTVSELFLCHPRQRIGLSHVTAGNWALVEGISSNIVKIATITSMEDFAAGRVEDLTSFAALKFDNMSVLKIAVEPMAPTDLPKMLHGIRCLNKTYPAIQTKVEESGEHVLFGPGELYLDSAMYDLREIFAQVEIKVSDPAVRFCETVSETSFCMTESQTPNGLNRLAMVAEPLETGLGNAIENGVVDLTMNRAVYTKILMDDFEWDKLAVRSLWAFGPTDNGPNALVDDTLPGSVDKSLLSSMKAHVVQGFRWGCKEGPLCDEPLRDVKLRILDCTLASEAIHRGAGYIIPTARRATHASFLTASPRLMEPIYSFEIQTVANMNNAILNVLRRRRGHITKELPIPGTPFFKLHGYLPVIDSVGFETDIRAQTNGLAFVMQVFDHWDMVPGSPLDTSIVLRPLETSRGGDIAREFMVKTRRRKGLPQEVSLEKYIDDPNILFQLKNRFQ